MTALVLYIAERYLNDELKAKITDTAKACVCEGLHLEDGDVTVVLEAFRDEDANERVAHCFFPVMYTPAGIPYEYKKKAGRLMKDRLTALIGEEEVPHCYFHMKEHDYDNVALGGKLLKFDDDAIKHVDVTRGEDSTPWLNS